MPHKPIITADAGGRPMIAGTQVAVAEILKEFATSDAVEVVLARYPELDRDDVQAALAYAAEALPVLELPAGGVPMAPPGEGVTYTEFGKDLWALRQAAVAEAQRHGDPLLDWDGIRREVRARRGEREEGASQ